MEPEGSLPLSQETTTGPHSEPDESIPHLPSYLPKIHSNIIFPFMPGSSEWCLPIWFSYQDFVSISHLSHAYCMPSPCRSPQFHDLNNICRSIEVTKHLSVQTSPASCHFLPLRSRYSPERPVPIHPQSVFFP